MPRLQNHDAEPVLAKVYIHCGKKPNKPQMHHTLCEKACREYSSGGYVDCPYYKDWHYEYYEKFQALNEKIEILNSISRRAG